MGGYLSTAASAAVSFMLLLHGMARWSEATAESYSADDLKQALLQAGGIVQLHHEVYAAVGEQAWEEAVKPTFMRNITLRVMRDTNNLLPGPGDILKWASQHQDETREILLRSAPSSPHP